MKFESSASSGEQLAAGHVSGADRSIVVVGKQLVAGNVSDMDSTTASADGKPIPNDWWAITLGATDAIIHPMPADVAAKHDDMAHRSARRKPRKACPCSKCDSIREEQLFKRMREAGARHDAGEAALRCGHEPGVTWTVIWDNAGYAHVYVPRSKRDPNRRRLLTLRREANGHHHSRQQMGEVPP